MSRAFWRSARKRCVPTLPTVAAGAALGLARSHSQTGYDREQDLLTDMNDRLLDGDAWLRVGSPAAPAGHLEVRLEQHRRRNTVEDVTERTKLTTSLLSFGTEQ